MCPVIVLNETGHSLIEIFPILSIAPQDSYNTMTPIRMHKRADFVCTCHEAQLSCCVPDLVCLFILTVISNCSIKVFVYLLTSERRVWKYIYYRIRFSTCQKCCLHIIRCNHRFCSVSAYAVSLLFLSFPSYGKSSSVFLRKLKHFGRRKAHT